MKIKTKLKGGIIRDLDDPTDPPPPPPGRGCGWAPDRLVGKLEGDPTSSTATTTQAGAHSARRPLRENSGENQMKIKTKLQGGLLRVPADPDDPPPPRPPGRGCGWIQPQGHT